MHVQFTQHVHNDFIEEISVYILILLDLMLICSLTHCIFLILGIDEVRCVPSCSISTESLSL